MRGSLMGMPRLKILRCGQILYSPTMKRLSASGATCATFTAAGVAKRGLKRAGFTIEKRQGFGRKRDMIVGRRAAKAKIQKLTSD